MPDPKVSPPPPPRSPPLRSFGGYEIEGELGRGGMGVVYLARQVELNRRVALKMLTGHYGPDELRRFLEEAETAAGLSHSNIAQIYEVGEHDGAPFFSMEYVESGSLADRLHKELPSAQDTAKLLIDIARALHYAHRNGVVHRDMKPGNVLLDQDGVPKLADFGIAKRLNDDTRLTRSGAVIGTPTYMAPEQAKGHSRHVGPAADIYSLGAILYEMLAGRPPFLPDDSETALTVRILTEEPVSPAWHRPEIPRDLETICMKCLEKQPRARYASAAALAEDLQRFLDDESILAKPPNTIVRTIKWARRHPWRFVAGLLVVMLTLAVLMRLGQWVLFERPRTEYAATFKTLRGGIEPDARLTAAEAGRREVSFRLTRQGLFGPITRVEAVNPRGHPAAVREVFDYDALPSWLEGPVGMQKREARRRWETTAIEFTFSGGQAVEAIALDRNQRISWRMFFDFLRTGQSQPSVRARFEDIRGYDIGREQSASRVEFERDDAGRDVRARFYSSARQPAINGEGVYGYTLEYDNNGRMSRLINLGRDGNAGLNHLGIGGLAVNYDSRGRLSRLSYLGVDGKPALYNKIATVTREYDEAGNLVHLRLLDIAGRLANSSEDLAAVDYIRNERGETTEAIWSRTKEDGTITTVSRMTIEYDANGYPSETRILGWNAKRTQFTHDQVGNITEARNLDPDGQPVTGAMGWSTRRWNYREAKEPPGWREEETYFDTAGGKTHLVAGHHRTIYEYDQVGQLRMLVYEDYDPKRFNYYRYTSMPELDAQGKLRRVVSRYEDKEGQLASKSGVTCTSSDQIFDDDGREVTKWELGCNVEAMGAPVFRTDTEWHKSGGSKRIRQASDANRQPLALISTGAAARSEQEFDANAKPQHIYEMGFDEKLVGFSTREVKFSGGQFHSVIHKRGDGTALPSVRVVITIVMPPADQPKSVELKPGDQLLAINGKPVTSAYAWAFAGEFAGGSIEVLREGRRLRIDGFHPGALGVALEDRAPVGNR